MKIEASGEDLRALVALAVHAIRAMTGDPSACTVDEDDEAPDFMAMPISDAEVYRIRERETGDESQCNGRNIKPGDSIITDEGDELIVRLIAMRKPRGGA